MALTGIDEARANLSIASSNYAKIQNELDKYNKIFETFSRASPETQIRAASVMRQAMDEYNGLKKQQEENSTKIYQAQQRIDYYNKNNAQEIQATQSIEQPKMLNGGGNILPSAPIEETIPVISVATPGKINDNTPSTNVEVLDSAPTVLNNQDTNISGAVGRVNYYTPPRSINLNTNTLRNSISTNWSNYGPGSVELAPGTGGMATLNATPTYNTTRGSNLGNLLNNYIRKGAKYILNRLKK